MAVRKNINMADETALWFEEKAKSMGVTQSSLMAIALQEYIKQDSALKTLTDMLVEMKKQNENN